MTLVETLGAWPSVLLVVAAGAAAGGSYLRWVDDEATATDPEPSWGFDAIDESDPDGDVASWDLATWEDTDTAGVATALPRRRLLGAAAVVGGAAAFGGIGTRAFFSDEERFGNDRLVTGELDLKVDWQEHYSDWSDDEAEGLATSMSPGEGLVGFPSTAPEAEQSVFVDDPGRFLRNTAVEAFPDVLAPESDPYDARQATLDDDSAVCDLDADLDAALDSPLRTRGTFGEDPNPQTTEAGDPLVDIADVKPGDFGVVTFGLHLCGNPGFVWLTGGLRAASENGVVDPEAESPDEADGVVELLDAVRAAVWYDTGADGTYGSDLPDKDAGEGDSFFGPGEAFVPLTGSLRSVLAALDAAMLPLDAEPLDGTAGAGDGDDGSAAGVSGDGASLADEVVVTTEDGRFADGPGGGSARNYQCADYEERLDVGRIVGSEVLDTDDEPVEAGRSYVGCTTVTVDEVDDTTGDVTLSTTGPVTVVSVKGGRDGETVYVFDDPVVLDGVTFTTPGGDFGISNVDVCCPVDGAGGQADGRQCLPNSTTAYVGFEWWVPEDVGNEIQTDSVSFDLGFYAEQCRHNDGSGRNGGAPGAGDGDGEAVEGDGAISFLAASVAEGRSVSRAEANFRVTEVLDTDDDQSPDDPCPDGFALVEKLEEVDG